VRGILPKRGFTLLEMIVTILIMAILLTTLYGSYSITFKTIEGSQGLADIYEAARVAIERIGEDLEGAYLPILKDEKGQQGGGIKSHTDMAFVGEERVDAGVRNDRISFVSMSHAGLSPENEFSGLSRITYVSRTEKEGEGFVLYREELPLLQKGSSGALGMLPLCRGLHSVWFFYHDESGTKYDNWDSSDGVNKGRLPALVSIKISFRLEGDREKSLSFNTSIAIPSRGEPDEKFSKRQ